MLPPGIAKDIFQVVAIGILTVVGIKIADKCIDKIFKKEEKPIPKEENSAENE